MTRSLRSPRPLPSTTLFSFFPRITPGNDHKGEAGGNSTRPTATLLKELPVNPTPVKVDLGANQLQEPLCSSDPSDDYVLLGPTGMQQFRAASVPQSKPEWNERDCCWSSICGSQKNSTSTRKTRRRRVNGASSSLPSPSTPYTPPPSRSQKRQRRARQPKRKAVSSSTVSPPSAVYYSTPAPFASPLSSAEQSFPPGPTGPPIPADHLEALPESIAHHAKLFFGIETLTPYQMSAVGACYQGKDVFVVLPTGAGKSLCYQLPALMPQAQGRFVLVISPLISLMEDQVLSLSQKQIPALTFSGARSRAWDDAKNGRYRLVYCSPEFVGRHLDRMVSYFQHQILLIAIDECHCVSEWGHHFRPSYRELARLRARFQNVPFMCLTATATAEVRMDVIRIFKLRPSKTLHLRGSVNRQNIYYRVLQRTSSVFADLGDFLALQSDDKERPAVDNSVIGPYSSTLIYVSTKQDAESLARTLKDAGVACAAYHAGLGTSERSTIHHQFLADELQVVCATVAFGMGIDKPDVRRIIHWCLPTSLESYVQQSGRAGRDRLPAEAVVLWASKDLSRTRNIVLRPPEHGTMSENYKQHLLKLFGVVVDYVHLEKQCRREFLMNYFGDVVPPATVAPDGLTPGISMRVAVDATSPPIVRCALCDICCGTPLASTTVNGSSTSSASPTLTIDLTDEVKVIIQCIIACKERTGVGLPCKVAIGSRSKEVLSRKLERAATFGAGASKPLQWWRELVALLLRRGYLNEKLCSVGSGPKGKSHYIAVRVTPQGRSFLTSTQSFLVDNPSTTLLSHLKKAGPGHTVTDDYKPPSPVIISSIQSIRHGQSLLRQKLMDLRLLEARKRKCAPFMVLPMPSLEHLVRVRPTTVDTLLRYTPQVPASCPTEFLEIIVQTIHDMATTYKLDTDLIDHTDPNPLVRFDSENVKEEYNWDDPTTSPSEQSTLADVLDRNTTKPYSCTTAQPLPSYTAFLYDDLPTTHRQSASEELPPATIDVLIPDPDPSHVELVPSVSKEPESSPSLSVYELSPSDVAEFDQLFPHTETY